MHSLTDWLYLTLTVTDYHTHQLFLSLTLTNCSSLSYPTGEPELQTLKGVWDPLISADLSALLFASSKGGLANQDGCLGAVVELINQLQGPYAILHTGKQSSHSISLYLSLSLFFAAYYINTIFLPTSPSLWCTEISPLTPLTHSLTFLKIWYYGMRATL